MLGLADGDRFEAQILADPVFRMDHQIAARERLKFAQEGIGIAPLLSPAHQPVAQQVLLRDELDILAGKPAVERQDRRGELAAAVFRGGLAERVLPAIGHRHADACLAQDRGDALAAALGIGGEDGALACLGDLLEVIGRRFVDIVSARTLGREIAGRPETEIDDRVALGLVEMSRAVDGALVQRGAQLVLRQIQRVRVERAIAARLLPGRLGPQPAVLGNV